MTQIYKFYSKNKIIQVNLIEVKYHLLFTTYFCSVCEYCYPGVEVLLL